jgi:hypothetical protein
MPCSTRRKTFESRPNGALARRTIDAEVVRTLLDMADQLEGRAEQQDTLAI